MPVPMEGRKSVSGVRKAAVLMMAIGSDASSRIYKHLTVREVELLTQEISRLEQVPSKVIKEICEEYYQLMMSEEYSASGGLTYAREILERAMGGERATEVLATVERTLEARALNVLKHVDPAQLSSLIEKESSQTIALILSQMKASQAAAVVSALTPSLRREVMQRFAVLESVPREMISEILDVLNSLLVTSSPSSHLGGVKGAAAVLNFVGRSIERDVLEEISKATPELATEIKNLMFVFEDIVKLHDRSIQRVLREVDTKELAVALKGVNEEVAEKFTANMSERAAEMLREEIEYMGPVYLRDVEEAQQHIVEVLRDLEDKGEIIIPRQGAEDIIV